jgi:hypothetical protein
MAVCYKLTASKFDPETASFVYPHEIEYFCAEESGSYLNPDGTTYSPHRVVYLMLGGVRQPSKIYRVTPETKLEKIGADCSNCSYATPYTPGSNGYGIDPNQPCDCLNGGCIPATTYDTPGYYPSLSACQSGCAKNSNCDGECVTAAQLASLQQAANNIRSRLCK